MERLFFGKYFDSILKIFEDIKDLHDSCDRPRNRRVNYLLFLSQ